MIKLLLTLVLTCFSTQLLADEMFIAQDPRSKVVYTFLMESVRAVGLGEWDFVVSVYDPRNKKTTRWPAMITGCNNGGGRYISHESVDYWTVPKRKEVAPIIDLLGLEVCTYGKDMLR